MNSYAFARTLVNRPSHSVDLLLAATYSAFVTGLLGQLKRAPIPEILHWASSYYQ